MDIYSPFSSLDSGIGNTISSVTFCNHIFTDWNALFLILFVFPLGESLNITERTNYYTKLFH
jgi:hypothetical protein